MPENIQKNPPKGSVKFSITLSDEQKLAKAEIFNHPYNFIIGKACLLYTSDAADE